MKTIDILYLLLYAEMVEEKIPNVIPAQSGIQSLVQKFKQRLTNLLQNLRQSNLGQYLNFKILTIAIIILALPITLIAVKTEQTLNQHASGPTVPLIQLI